MQSRFLSGTLISLVLCALWGCSYAMSTLQEPETLGPGKVRLTPQVRINKGFGNLDNNAIMFGADVQARVGVLERLELQVAASTAYGGRLGLKVLLVDWQALKLALVPSYQIQRMNEDGDDLTDEAFLPEYRVQTAILPLIIGIPVAARADVLVGADVHAGRRKAEDFPRKDSGPVLAFGGHLGMALHTRRGYGTFVPQCGVLVGAVAASETSMVRAWERDTLRRGSLRWECALGLSFGSRYSQRKH